MASPECAAKRRYRHFHANETIKKAPEPRKTQGLAYIELANALTGCNTYQTQPDALFV